MAADGFFWWAGGENLLHLSSVNGVKGLERDF